MLMKQSLLFFFAILLLTYMINQCEAIYCYSCSDCNDANKSTWKNITTVNPNDQCIRVIAYTKENGDGQKLTYRSASSNCQAFTNNFVSILCCRTDFCNA